MISRAYRSASSLHRFLRGLLGGKARPFMTSSPARLLGLFQVSERLLQPIRRAIGHFRPVLTGYYTLSSLFLHLVLRIERKTGTSGTFAQFATVGANVTSYIDSGLTSGTTFCYRLLAYNVAGDSAYSNEACGTTPQDFSLTVVRAGMGSGTVSSTPAGISCGTDCSEPYASGTAVALTPTSAAGAVFGGWSGGCTGTGSCTVTMTVARTVTATFNPAVMPPAAPTGLLIR